MWTEADSKHMFISWHKIQSKFGDWTQYDFKYPLIKYSLKKKHAKGDYKPQYYLELQIRTRIQEEKRKYMLIIFLILIFLTYKSNLP